MTKPSEELTIFDEQISRKPNRYPWTEKYIEAMHNGFWTDKEFTFKSDVHQFKTVLTEQEQEIIIRTLSAIGQIEVAVKTFWSKLGDNLPHPSLQDLGFVMANVEVIHNNAYERLLSVLGLNDIFEENLKLDWIQGRVKYLKKYTHRFYKDSKKQYLYALILFTLFVENVSLFSQFYIINWFGRFKNVLKDTDQQVCYTRNEELIHALVGIEIINTIRKELPDIFDEELEERILHEAEQAFVSESKIID
jgi:ribonucleoside-diphosphate reductase beta chain